MNRSHWQTAFIAIGLLLALGAALLFLGSGPQPPSTPSRSQVNAPLLESNNNRMVETGDDWERLEATGGVGSSSTPPSGPTQSVSQLRFFSTNRPDQPLSARELRATHGSISIRQTDGSAERITLSELLGQADPERILHQVPARMNWSTSSDVGVDLAGWKVDEIRFAGDTASIHLRGNATLTYRILDGSQSSISPNFLTVALHQDEQLLDHHEEAHSTGSFEDLTPGSEYLLEVQGKNQAPLANPIFREVVAPDDVSLTVEWKPSIRFQLDQPRHGWLRIFGDSDHTVTGRTVPVRNGLAFTAADKLQGQPFRCFAWGPGWSTYGVLDISSDLSQAADDEPIHIPTSKALCPTVALQGVDVLEDIYLIQVLDNERLIAISSRPADRSPILGAGEESRRLVFTPDCLGKLVFLQWRTHITSVQLNQEALEVDATPPDLARYPPAEAAIRNWAAEESNIGLQFFIQQREAGRWLNVHDTYLFEPLIFKAANGQLLLPRSTTAEFRIAIGDPKKPKYTVELAWPK